ncbi:peptidase T [Enterovibrio paralichthyis]|uniref:peptidase T n=1 Tax=Enterovibrio paralichthyis TaxID=2853805 RepID=UPI001C4962EB|nr:peptidase T [Enterovibrio paralichthyis]MBV7298391.1 peptidase T [Enterovibrio paralichthyis]
MNIVDRFLAYTRINTTTSRENGAAGIMPSSPGQRVLAELLKSELEALGLCDILLNERAILTATLPANTDKSLPVVSFFAHLDTSAEQTADTKAHIVHYTGGDVTLNADANITMPLAQFPELNDYIGQDLIVTDGTSLLGADDKAGIAAIMHMLQYFKANPEIERGTVKVGFVPDEEQGLRGAKAFDVESFGADFAYTLDCGGIGEFVYENWNAGDVVVTFTGQSAHPMSAKGKLKNSLLMAHKFIAMLPPGEAPEYTEGREGYYWVKELQGNSAKTTLKMDVRDFTKAGYQHRMNFLKQLAASCETLWGEGSVTITLADRYENVKNSLEGDASFPIDIAKAAYARCGIEVKAMPMRGGYDGAVLSQKGLPCPNLFTGAHNFHSIYEFLPVKSLHAAADVLVEIVKITAER